MSPSRLPAKLMPRRAAGAFPRPRLHAALDSLTAPLLWVHGPAGAGKTTLVADWAAAERRATLWYRVDPADADPATLFACLRQGVAALARKPGLPLPLLTPEFLPDLTGFARRYFHQLGQALPVRAVLVFDAAESAGTVLPKLLSLAPEQLGPHQRIVVTSREAAPAALAPMRVKGELALLTWQDLRMTVDEARALAQSRGLDTEQAEALRQHCDGWIAGYTLLLNVWPGSPAATSRQLREEIFPYYLKELFERAETPLQTLMMRCALLPSFSTTQAQTLAPEADADAMLHALHRRNFFLERSDGSPPMWRLHALFREFLLEQGRARTRPADLRAQQRHAAALLVDEGRAEEALPLLHDAGAWDDAAALTLSLVPGWMAQGRFMAVQAAILAQPQPQPQLPPQQAAWLDYWLGMARMPVAPDAALEKLEQAYRRFRDAGDAPAALQCCAAVLDCHFMALSVSPEVDRWGDAVQELLQSSSALEHTLELRVLSATTVLHARADRHAPLLRHARQRLLQLLEGPCDDAGRLTALHFLCMGSVWRGEWAVVRHQLDLAGSRISLAGLPLMLRLVWMSVHVIEGAWSGRFAQTLETIDRLEREAHANGIWMLDAVLAGYRAYVAANAGSVDSMEECVSRMTSAARPDNVLDAANVAMLASVLAMMRGDPERAHATQQKSLQRCEVAGATMFAEAVRLMQAAAAVQRGQLDAATRQCEQCDDFGRRSEMPAFSHTAGWIRAWIAWRRGDEATSMRLLGPVLAQGRALGFKVVFPWLPQDLLQELAPAALAQGLEPDHLRDILRLRQIDPPAHRPLVWPWPVRLHTLGRFELVLQGRPWQPPPKTPKRPLELLKALVALGGGEAVATLTLQEALWPDMDGAAAHNAFHAALHRLRRLLGDEQALGLVDGRLQPDPQRVWLDVQALQRLADPPQLPAGERAQALLALCRGGFLEGEDMPWSLVARRRWWSCWRRACGRAAAELADDPARTAFWQQVVERDPASEPAHQALIVALLSQGRRAEARQALLACVEMLQQMTGQGPSPGTLALQPSVGDR